MISEQQGATGGMRIAHKQMYDKLKNKQTLNASPPPPPQPKGQKLAQPPQAPKQDQKESKQQQPQRQHAQQQQQQQQQDQVKQQQLQSQQRQQQLEEDQAVLADYLNPGQIQLPGQEPTIQQLQIELHVVRSKCTKLERENKDLRASLRKTISDSALGRELEIMAADRERLIRLVDQLKTEKGHLVDTVLQLSNEVDELQRIRVDDHLKFKQEVLKHSDVDKKLRNAKYKLGMQIVDILRQKSIDTGIIQEIQMVVTNASMYGVRGMMNEGVNQQFTKLQIQKGSDGGPSGDNRLISLMHAQANLSNVPLGTTSIEQVPTLKGDGATEERSGRLRTSAGTGERKTGKSPGRRKKDILDRDETDSIISSVSTHRSGRSTGTHKSTGMSKSRKGAGITKEALDELDRQCGKPDKPPRANGEDGLIFDKKKVAKTKEAGAPADRGGWWGFF